MNSAKKRWVAGLAVMLVFVIPLIVKHQRSGMGTAVNVIAAHKRALHPAILASGTLAYTTEVSLTAEVLARVSNILVKEGDTVEAGQLLLELDPKTYENAINRERASLRQSLVEIVRQRAALVLKERQYERSLALIKDQLIDMNSVEESRHQLQRARADLQYGEEAVSRSQAILVEAHEQRAKTRIRSPLTGTIVLVSIKGGETAIPSTSALAGAQLMKIADISEIQAELKVDEADIGKVVTGQGVRVIAAAFPFSPLPGRVEKIALDPMVEGMGRAYKVTTSLRVPNAMALRSGMSVRAEIQLSDGGEHLAVPVESVITAIAERGEARRHVWVVRDGAARRQEIETGVSDDDWEAVRSGLAAGDQVISGPARTLRALHDGERVMATIADHAATRFSAVRKGGEE